ncbi:MAG: VTT domain-containing protein [Acetobacter orientalis]|uniref:TVP38/TMEM64 family protein n=1 Tax=Acetobacter orientalis TaxID=146474 RepID=UPI0039E789F8
MKKLTSLSTIIVFIFLIVGFYLYDENITQNIVDYFYHMRQTSPLLGLFVFCILQTLIAVCGILPASVGAITSGMVFGVWNGFLIASATTLAGALIAFWLSRSIFRRPIQSFLSKHRFFLMLEQMTEKQGWRMVCLLRISPVLPFAITSYVLGFTELSTADYILGTLASLPALLGYVFIGTLTQNGFSQTATGSIFYIKLAMTFIAILGTFFLIRKISQVLKDYLKNPKINSLN